MGVMTVLFDQEAAMESLTAWLSNAVGTWYTQRQIRRGQRSVPADSQRQVTAIPLTPIPIDEAWVPISITDAQANVVLVDVAIAAAGTYSLHTLAGVATYVAGGGDTPTDIRDALRAAVDALAGPYTTADEGAAGFVMTANTAGEWLEVYPTVLPAAAALVITTVDDVLRRVRGSPGQWTVRLIIDDIRPDKGHSVVVPAANYIRQILAAVDVPVTNGSAYPYAGDLLALPGDLVVLDVGTVNQVDYQQPGAAAVWRERAMVDVVFQTPNGITYDMPNLQTIGVPEPIIE